MPDFGVLSREERALYNPAFVGLVAVRATQGFELELERAQPCHVLFIATVTAMALTPQVRGALPTTTATNVISWIEREAEVRTYLKSALPEYSSIVRAGLLFALRRGALVFAPPSTVNASRTVAKAIKGETGETIAIQSAAHFLGRWLPKAGDLPTTLSLLGIRP